MPYENKLCSLHVKVDEALHQYIQSQYNLFHSTDRVGLMHSLNHLGNAVQLVQLLEQNLSLEEVEDLIQASFFQMNIPKQFIRPGDNKEEKKKRAEAKYRTHHAVSVIENCCSETEANIVRESDLLTKERLCCGLSVFDTFLKRIGQTLSNHTLWQNRQDKLAALMSGADNGEFYRLWSGMQLCYAIPPPPMFKQSHNYLAVDVIGDGVVLGACTLMALCGQQKKFEATDMCFSLLDNADCDDQPLKEILVLSNSSESINIADFLQRVKSFQALHTQLFNMINRYLQVPSDSSADKVHNVNVYGVQTANVSRNW